jgi:hypothetical protein
MKHNATDVFAAFDVLLEEIEAEIGLVDKAGAQAFEQRDYDRARDALERAGHLTAFRTKVASLRDEWNANLGPTQSIANREEEEHASQRNLGRLKKGRKTPETAYFRPILQALVDLGGSANLNEVLDQVEPMVKKSLKPIDFEPLASDPSQIRWRNTAQWARFTMVQQDLLNSDSPRGVWEITDKGRRYLLHAK